MDRTPLRVVLAKIGLDGHDRGLKVVARMLRDAGIEVIYLGLRQTPDSVATAARDEDADVVGISTHNASHLTVAAAVREALDGCGTDIPLVVGGIIPPDDLDPLAASGVAGVLGPGASATDVVAAVRAAARTRASE
jgi:methylmalonyl-CoA mutase, C-terminal domain